MSFSSLRFLATTGLTCLLAGAAHAAELPIIAKARAHLGTDAAIDALKSMNYVGTLTHPDPRDPTKQISAKLEIIFQKPDKQRITATYDEVVETTALDGYEGWTRVESRKDPGKFRLTPLDAAAVKRLRASTWETLSYYRGIEKIGGWVEDKGVATQDGVSCRKVEFHHDDKISFVRYFDAATGRLMFTETENGATLRESGEILVNGVRFPKTMTTTSGVGDKRRTISLTYDKITVNEVHPAKTFAYPNARNQ
jgi:hypothetical protein